MVWAVSDEPTDCHSTHGRQHQHDPDRCCCVADDVSDTYILTVVDGDENETGQDHCHESKADDATKIDGRGASVFITHLS